jgi:hypothetical protein
MKKDEIDGPVAVMWETRNTCRKNLGLETSSK